jgi:pyridoxine 5-phosphate synthase
MRFRTTACCQATTAAAQAKESYHSYPAKLTDASLMSTCPQATNPLCVQRGPIRILVAPGYRSAIQQSATLRGYSSQQLQTPATCAIPWERMLKLGVNIDHVATLREARYRGRSSGEPDPVAAALACEQAGAHGITAHLREDRRHIQDRDIWKLREVIKTRLNLEMANAPEIRDIALRLKPDIVCIVPERRQEVTTEGGLDVAGHLPSITDTCKRMNDAGIEVSLFIAPDLGQIDAAAKTGTQFIELHTGSFAEAFLDADHRASELQRLLAGARQAHGLGIKVNAGHGLNYNNLPVLCQVPHLVELNIGHSIVSRAVSVGLPAAVREMLQLMRDYRGSKRL